MSTPASGSLGGGALRPIQSPANAPKPGQFDSDVRVHYDQNVSKWQYEDESGAEYEWSEGAQVWIPIVSTTSLRPSDKSESSYTLSFNTGE